MPKYRLPKPKKDPYSSVEADAGWMRHISVPINDEISRAVSAGDQVTVTLTGKIRSMNSHEKGGSIEVDVSVVEVYEKGSRGSQADYEKSRRGQGPHY